MNIPRASVDLLQYDMCCAIAYPLQHLSRVEKIAINWIGAGDPEFQEYESKTTTTGSMNWTGLIKMIQKSQFSII